MRKPYAVPVTRASPAPVLAEPRVRPAVLGFAGFLSGAYARVVLGVTGVEYRHPERLVAAMADALSGKARLVVAFRHAYGEEPQILSWAFLRGLPRVAAGLGARFPRRPHAAFVHGYEVARWSGPFVRWLLPRVGALPVHHAAMDRGGIARLLSAMEDGDYPLALAPEGQVSYSSESVPRLEQGAVRLGFQAADHIDKAGRPERVVLLPLSVHYRYGPRAEGSLARLVSRTEGFLGLSGSGGTLSARLDAATESALGLAETLYGLVPSGGSVSDRGSVPGRRSEPDSSSVPDRGSEPDSSSVPARRVESDRGSVPGRRARVEALVAAALDSAERILGMARGAGDAIERLYRIRQIGWDRVFLPGSPAAGPNRVDGMAPLERALADRRAGEAWYAMRHMELADFSWYFRGEPPSDGAPLHERIEYAQNLWDLCNRLAGGAFVGRLSVRPRRAVVVAGEPLDLSARLPGYRDDRKAAVGAAMSDLEKAYMTCIKEIIHEDT